MSHNQPPPLVPQLILTVAGDQVHLESSDALPVTSPHPAGSTEEVLAAIGRWLFLARRAAAGETPGTAPNDPAGAYGLAERG